METQKDLNMSLSKQLRNAIKTSGVSLYRIAKDADIPYSVVHRFANEERQIKLDVADKLAKYFGMKLTEPKRVSSK
jgi:ribosome-binding protein aMBF1 (putative translation factor)